MPAISLRAYHHTIKRSMQFNTLTPGQNIDYFVYNWKRISVNLDVWNFTEMCSNGSK